MPSKQPIRHEMASRRAMREASVGAGAAMLLPWLACANNGSQTLANALAEPEESRTLTTSDSTELESNSEVSEVETEPVVETASVEGTWTVVKADASYGRTTTTEINNHATIIFTG